MLAFSLIVATVMYLVYKHIPAFFGAIAYAMILIGGFLSLDIIATGIAS